MKKIVTVIATLALASSVFAADMAAKVKMTGSIADGGIKGDKAGKVNLLTLNKEDQKDADALVISTSGDKAGANFQFWYNYNGGAAADLTIKTPESWETPNLDGKVVGLTGGLQVRTTNIWFKPASMVKVTVGDVTSGTFKEMIFWWKDPTGASKKDSSEWNGKYSSYSIVEGAGALVEVTPVDGLAINAGVAAGAGNSTISFVKGSKPAVAAYGAEVTYNFTNLIGAPVSAAISWRDAGTGAEKVLSVGADYGTKFGDGFYGFLNARMRFEAGDLAGIAFDNYVKYATGALKVEARVPVIVRLADTDESYMEFAVKCSYAIDAYTPYLLVASDLDNAGEIGFQNFGDDFNVETKAGVTFNIGSCSLDLAAEVDYAKGKLNWSVPFEFGVAF